MPTKSSAGPSLGGLDSRGYGINEHGHVVGSSALDPNDPWYQTHVFYYDGIAMDDLGLLGNGSKAYDVNDSGKAVGQYVTTDSHDGAFFYDGSSLMDIGTLGGDNAKALAINEHDQIIGYANMPSDVQHGFISDGSGFGPQLFDDRLLLSIDTAGQYHEEELPWLENEAHVRTQ